MAAHGCRWPASPAAAAPCVTTPCTAAAEAAALRMQPADASGRTRCAHAAHTCALQALGGATLGYCAQASGKAWEGQRYRQAEGGTAGSGTGSMAGQRIRNSAIVQCGKTAGADKSRKVLRQKVAQPQKGRERMWVCQGGVGANTRRGAGVGTPLRTPSCPLLAASAATCAALGAALPPPAPPPAVPASTSPSSSRLSTYCSSSSQLICRAGREVGTEMAQRWHSHGIENWHGRRPTHCVGCAAPLGRS